jgi:hypothetical protein
LAWQRVTGNAATPFKTCLNSNKPMHYKNGRPANNGDPVIHKFNGTATVIAGVLHSTMPGSTSCNGQIAFPIPGGVANWCVTVGECFHAEDALGAVEAAMIAEASAKTGTLPVAETVTIAPPPTT